MVIAITPRERLVVRDGRPFGPGGTNRAYSVGWPYPSVTAGAVRTVLGKIGWEGSSSPFEDTAFLEALKRVEVAGPLLLVHGEAHFPAASDAVVYKGGTDGRRGVDVLRPRPLGPGEGCNLPLGLLPVQVDRQDKPAGGATFWSAARMAEWLAGDGVPPGFEAKRGVPGFPAGPEMDERVHVSIERGTGTSREGRLFMTRGLAFPRGQSLAVRVETDDNRLRAALDRLPVLHPIGGERRLAEFAVPGRSDGPGAARTGTGGTGEAGETGPAGWPPAQGVVASLRGARGVRMVLATPALFAGGWRPGWLDPRTFEGSPPGAGPDLRLALRGACIERWRPISGWSLETGPSRDGPRRGPGPKPVRRLVPAGGVYFFEVLDGRPAELAERLWLRSVCDEAQDRLDGFGLALWGIWDVGRR